MREALAVLALTLLFLGGTAFAAGNLTITPSSLAPSFINTNESTAMLNLSLNATVGTVNITALNVTIVNLTGGNVSFVEVKNATGTAFGASYSVNGTTNVSTVAISSFNVTTAANSTLLVSISLYRNATLLTNFSANITAATAVGVDTGSNVTISGSFAQSNGAQIHDVHANATVTPLFVDTNIINQSLIYSFATDGRNSIYNISIVVPTEYVIVNVTEVKQGSSTLYNATVSIVSVSFNRTTGAVNVTNTASGGFSTSGSIIVNISVNASSSTVAAQRFNSTLTGSNLSAIAPNVSGTNTSVAAQSILNVTNVKISKGTAIANGTDFWEFNYTINFTANVSGIVQFRLTNWNDTENRTIALTNGSDTNATHYATFRDSANSSHVSNVTNAYNLSDGVTLTSCCNTTSVYTMILKMVIPGGTASSSSWYATYGLMFRAT